MSDDEVFDMDLRLTCLHCDTEAMEGYDVGGLFLCSPECVAAFPGLSDHERRTARRTDAEPHRGPVFDHLPSAGEIAEWFREEEFARRFENPGGDATRLSSDPHSHLWKLAEVDHDEQVFYLLDIGTDLDGTTTHDLLFVTAGLRERLGCEWRQKPSTVQPWGYDALVWFAERIEFANEHCGVPLAFLDPAAVAEGAEDRGQTDG